MQLRSPDFGNTVTVDTGSMNQRSQDGDLLQIYDDTWGHEDSFTVTFSALTEDQKYALIDFYRNNIGLEITFIDHEQRSWLGFLTSKIVFRQTGRGCQYTATFSFLGVLQ